MSIKHSPEIIKTNLILNLDALNKNSYNYTENLLQYSEKFTNSWWNGGTVTRTDNTLDTTDPFGQNNASKIQATNQSFGGLLRTWSSPIVAGTQYTLSVYAKAGSHRYLGLCPQLVSSYSDPLGGDRYVFYDLYSGKVTNNITALTNSSTISSCGIIDVGNGWYRCWITGTPGGANGITDISIVQSNGGNNYTPAGTEYVYIYGAQLEKGSILSNYTQTTSSQINKKLSWYDLSGNSNNGSLVNGPTYSELNNGSLYFNGSSQYVSVNHNSNLIFSSSDSMSLSAWFKPTVLQNKWTGIVTKSRDISPWYGIWINTSNQIVWGAPGLNMVAGTASTNWQNVVITKNNLGCYIYVNGVLINSSSTIIAANGTGPLYIGGAASVSEYFIGYIGDVKVYSIALSASEILQNFNALRGRYSI